MLFSFDFALTSLKTKMIEDLVALHLGGREVKELLFI